MKKLYFAAIAVIVLGAGTYITSTPEFAITRLSLAAKEKSLERFEMNADIKAIAHNLVNDSVTQPFSQALGAVVLAAGSVKISRHWSAISWRHLFRKTSKQQ
ncbi:MAG: hypothetical protein IPP97_11130 [Candidatus Obscuribacter sp.]|nr:hypothetical protein [Candidatus Obscuribacter sp.]